MKKMFYQVALHTMQIGLPDELDAAVLLQSCQPFACEATQDVLFTLTVERGAAPDFSSWLEIGQFDCGGANHGVYRNEEGGYAFEISLPALEKGEMTCVLQTNASFTEAHATLLTDVVSEQHFGLNNAIMMTYAFAAATKQTLLIHASVIRKDGYGYLFTAPSGTGKSTHTFLWYKNIPDCDLMNDDNPVVRIVDNEVRIYGSPWSGKTPCYRNIWAPVGAITRIEQRPVNEIAPMAPIDSFTTLLTAVSSMKWDERVYMGICDTIEAMVPMTPMFLLGCRPDAEAAHVCYEAVRRA